MNPLSVIEAKPQANALRASLAAKGTTITHVPALGLVAHKNCAATAQNRAGVSGELNVAFSNWTTRFCYCSELTLSALLNPTVLSFGLL